MTTQQSSTLTAQAVADFLQANPRFFSDHADVFAQLMIPDDDQGQSISLVQRQLMTLRQKLRSQDKHLQELAFYAQENQTTSQQITRWCEELLAVDKAEALPQCCVQSLAQCFEGLQVALRLWPEALASNTRQALEAISPEVLQVAPTTQAVITEMAQPYSGSNYPAGLEAWFEQAPASVAIVPLQWQGACFGTLVFASEQADHFQEQAGLGFLRMIQRLTSAAMSRLLD